MKLILAKIWKLLSLPKQVQLFIMRLMQDTFLVGVTGLIVNNKNEILLCQHTYRGNWSLPGGYMKAKEHPLEGLVREIEEETGFIVRVNETARIRTDRQAGRLDIVCMGNYVGGEFKQSDEVADAKFFPLHDLPLLPKSQLLLVHQIMNTKSSN